MNQSGKGMFNPRAAIIVSKYVKESIVFTFYDQMCFCMFAPQLSHY